MVHEQIAQDLKEHPAKDGMVFNVLVTAVEIGGSIGLFHLARRLGVNDVASYLIGSIAPVLGGFMAWAKARKFSGASAAIFAFTALSAVIALIGSRRHETSVRTTRRRGSSSRLGSTRVSLGCRSDGTTQRKEF